MIITFSSKAWDDYLYWQQTDKTILDRVNEIIKDIGHNPFKGLGKPEPLRFNLTGYWSRRISKTDRFVYKVETNTLFILQCRHYY